MRAVRGNADAAGAGESGGGELNDSSSCEAIAASCGWQRGQARPCFPPASGAPQWRQRGCDAVEVRGTGGRD
jgi:hypothetical protein